MRIIYSITLFFLITSYGFSSIKSSTGNIDFDVNQDSIREARLNSQGLVIGTGEPSSNLQVHGTLSLIPTTLTSSTNLSETQSSSILLIDTSGDNILINLPYAGNVLGRHYTIKKTSTLNTLYLGGSGNYIDQHPLLEITDSTSDLLPSISLISDGSNWMVTHSEGNIQTFASDNLVGLWNFDETTGTSATDSSGQNNNGTLTNMTFSSNSVTGKLGRALTFDGNEYVTLGSGKPTILQFSDQPFTLSVWVNIDFTGNFGRIIGADNGGGSSHGYTLRDNGNTTTGNFGFYFSEGAGNSERTSTGLTGWHLLTGIYDGSKNYLYVDGVLESSTTVGSITPTWGSVSEISIGRRGSTNYYKGIIDDVRIYNRALTATEISTYYATTK